MNQIKANKEEIEFYIQMLFVSANLDWNGYLALMKFKNKCLETGKIIFIK